MRFPAFLSTTPSSATSRKQCSRNADALWGKECFVIPEYAFAVKVESTSLQLSHEHTEYNWLTYEEAQEVLQYDSNKTALWELNRRIELEIWK